MEALKGKGIKAKMLVRDKQTDRGYSRTTEKIMETYLAVCLGTCNYLESKPFQKHNLFAVDIANMGTDITSLPEFQQADVIHLH